MRFRFTRTLPSATMLVAMSTEMATPPSGPGTATASGIRREPALQAAVGHDRVRRRGVGPHEPDEAPLGRHLGVVGEPADVVRAPHADGGEARAARPCRAPPRPPGARRPGRGRGRRRRSPSSASPGGRASPGADSSRPSGSSRRTAASGSRRGNRGPGGWRAPGAAPTHWASSSGTPRAAKMRVASVCSGRQRWVPRQGPPGGARGLSTPRNGRQDTTGLEAGRVRGPRRERRARA